MMKPIVYLTLLSVITLFSMPSFALAKFGHKIVCQLAFEQLPQAKQHKVNQLLHAIPLEHQRYINQYNRDKHNAAISFAKACTWADAIKKQKSFKHYNTWHYINVPRDLLKVTNESCLENCLPQAIIKHQQQLTSPLPPWKLAQSLMFLGHWLGDIHQPLHVSFADDLGGNKTRFSNKQGQCKNLHWYWDTCLIQQAKRNKVQWVEYLNKQWNTEPVPSFQNQQVWQWADESYQLIRAQSFQYCLLNNKGFCQRPKKDIRLTNDYANQYLPVMERQLLKAAKRLHHLLDASL